MNALDCCPDAASEAYVSSCRLFAELIDLRHLTHFPKPDYATQMVSSFDRRSEKAQPGSADWFANRDYAELEPGRETVLLDVDGPGVLTRFWSANPSGILRIYLDEAAQPSIEAPMRALLRGELTPFGPGFAFEAGSGSNLYLPISYQTHCKVTITSPARKLYYQISRRSYAPSVRIEAFSRDALTDPRGMAQFARAQLERLPWIDPQLSAANTEHFELGATGPLSRRIRAPSGGGLLTELRVELATTDPDALRETLLHIAVDGEETVRVPLGDFFGSGPGLQPLHALPMSVDLDARSTRLVARWPMPFAESIELSVERAAAPPLGAAFEVRFNPERFTPEQLLFHAYARPVDWQSSEPTHAFTMIALVGTGFLVGSLLNVTNTQASWWGEGDEQIWLDDETFPSFFGTGTEDYFGYGYCSNQRFSQAYVGLTRSDRRANFGRSSQYRFHVADPIRFRTRLRFDWEVNHWGDTPSPIAYDGIVYFYARSGARLSTEPAAASAYRVPVLDVPEPAEVPAAPYRCGGS
jgi:hypothetical protein